jgi:hypothetical protein
MTFHTGFRVTFANGEVREYSRSKWLYRVNSCLEIYAIDGQYHAGHVMYSSSEWRKIDLID